MARKIYKTLNDITSYTTGLVMPDKKTKVYAYFEGGVTHPKFIPSTYSTSDKDVQKALENSANYGKKFTLAATVKDEPKKKVESPAGSEDLKDQDMVDGPALRPFGNTSVPTAITTLIKQGWEGDADELVDVESVQAAGKTIGITFDKLK